MMVVPKEPAGARLSSHVAAADSAAMAIVLQLSQPSTTHWFHTSKVDEELCGGCASCVKTCAFGACFIDPKTGLSHVDVRRCRGCGKCVVSCPVGARDIVSSPHDYVVGAIKSLAATETDDPKVLGFLCSGCGYPAADRAGDAAMGNGHTYPASFLPLRIPCGGRLDAQYVLEAYRSGFDGISVFRCREGHCHNLIGNLDMDRRINLLREVLRSRNLDDARLRIVDIAPEDGEGFISAVNELYETIDGLADGKGES
jgi:F420-non-reducing hydrogenase iron-sulfur subunit